MPAPSPFLENPRNAFGVLAGYFLLHVLLRSFISDSLQTDEAEQCLTTQMWLWGYGSQPPLYTWLQIPLFAVFGVKVFALSILKNALLFCIYLFTYLTGREIFQDARPALLATFSLLMIVLFAWESQRDQTHLVLATAIAAATVFVTVRLFKTPTAGWYCLLGGLAGLGLLAKYNYAVVIVALLLAAISLPALRPAVLNGRMFLAIACFLLVVSPHAWWAWTHTTLLLSQSYKFNIPRAGDLMLTSLWGGVSLLRRTVEYTVGPLAVYGLLTFRTPKDLPATTNRLPVALLNRMIILGLALCLATILVFGVTMIRARWLQPLLISLPLVLVAWTQPRLDPRRGNAVFALAAVVMLTVPAVMYGRVAAADWIGRSTNWNIPYGAFAAQIRAAGFTQGVIVAENHLIAGNLRLNFPESTVIGLGDTQFPIPLPDQAPVLLAWRPGEHTNVPPRLLKFAAREFRIAPQQWRAEQAYAFALYAPGITETLGYAFLQCPAK